jgi:hypothetical protein
VATRVLRAGREKRAFVTKRREQKAHRDLRAGESAGFEPPRRRRHDSGTCCSRRHARPRACRVRHSSRPALSPARRPRATCPSDTSRSTRGSRDASVCAREDVVQARVGRAEPVRRTCPARVFVEAETRGVDEPRE